MLEKTLRDNNMVKINRCFIDDAGHVHQKLEDPERFPYFLKPMSIEAQPDCVSCKSN